MVVASVKLGIALCTVIKEVTLGSACFLLPSVGARWRMLTQFLHSSLQLRRIGPSTDSGVAVLGCAADTRRNRDMSGMWTYDIGECLPRALVSTETGVENVVPFKCGTYIHQTNCSQYESGVGGVTRIRHLLLCFCIAKKGILAEERRH